MNDELLFRALAGRADAPERAQVQTWRRKSPENEQAYQELARILSLASSADRVQIDSPPPELSMVLEMAGRQGSARESRPQAHGARNRSRPIAIPVAALKLAAAAVVFLLIGAGINGALDHAGDGLAASAAHEFVTGPHERASVVLKDGTVVRLGSDSRLRVPGNGRQREVSISGRAYFAVAEDKENPFRIRTPDGEVTVLGTRFALEALGEDLRLVVVEGLVELNAGREEVKVEANQVARIIRGNALPIITVPDPAGATDWAGDFLAFQDTPLRDAAQEIGRKYDIKVELAEPALGNRTVTAWFSGQTLEEVLDVVCIIADVKCEISASRIMVRPQV